jgi:hypothetical protein
LLCAITHINSICKEYNINNGSLMLGCDGISALQCISNEFHQKSTLKHFNIINSIKHSIKCCPLNWNFIHIPGHQDDFTHFDDLSRSAQLNIISDSMAKSKLNEMIQRPRWHTQRPQHLPHEKVEIYWRNGKQVQSKITSTLTKTPTKTHPDQIH